MGFIPDIKRIMALLPATARRQNLLFSATFSDEIKKLADALLNEPQLIEVARRNTAAETVTQSVYKVSVDQKRALLKHLVNSRDLRQVLCFVRTKHGAARLARQLEKEGLETTAIHGDKSQAARLEALEDFKNAKVQVMVATDVAARGLDIDDLPLVVNYELPHVPEDYIHRIGRTGRAGASGEAVSFCAPEEEKFLGDIERMLKRKITIAIANVDGERRSSREARPSHPSRTAHERPQRERPAPRGRAATPPREETLAALDRPYVAAEQPAGAPETRNMREPAALTARPADGGWNRKPKPIPALLMKRRVPEPQNA
jgi:ATP-dependent RNA helicase RhlE